MRTDKLLAELGYGTRKEVKKMLKKGGVFVDGEPVNNGAVQVDPEEQRISVFGEDIHYTEFVYFLMHKPSGVISATEDSVHDTVLDILEQEDAIREPFPVGRLDIDTEGLLLLTNDGKLNHFLTSPKHGVVKIYRAVLEHPIEEKNIEHFKKGVKLDDGYVCKPAVLRRVPDTHREVYVEVTEGKFHQVKRMFEAVGNEVVYLKREAFGQLSLDEDLLPGEYRELNEDEIQLLRDSVGEKSEGAGSDEL
ncbi:pseudouridine synthase [uncultured Marinococcus sp.]|uniref:pseudouridine synthase n=1 Tax=uncultured Marinococcus sp. TaxID=487012 RepID=UPI00261B41F0|nr:pseudouridine synthase [uncultured Marinococcus sp.]